MAVSTVMSEEYQHFRSAKRRSFLWRLGVCLSLTITLGSIWLIVALELLPDAETYHSLTRRLYSHHGPISIVPITQQLDQNADGTPDQSMIWTIPTGQYGLEDLMGPAENDTKPVHDTRVNKRDDMIVPRRDTPNMVQCSECDINPHGNCSGETASQHTDTDYDKLHGRCSTYAQLCHSVNDNLRHKYDMSLTLAADMNEDGSVWIFGCATTSFYRTE